MPKVKANWSGIVSIDIEVVGDKIDDASLKSATQLLRDELAEEIQEHISSACCHFPEGGKVQISDVCIEPFHIIEGEESKDGEEQKQDEEPNG